jgi:hypothetical protein
LRSVGCRSDRSGHLGGQPRLGLHYPVHVIEEQVVYGIALSIATSSASTTVVGGASSACDSGKTRVRFPYSTADTPRWDATTAIDGLYRPPRSTEILSERDYHETQKLINRGERPDAAAPRASRPISEITTAFDDARVENWEPHDGIFNPPDPDVERVVPTALVGGAGAIVADNLKDFPIGMSSRDSWRSTRQEDQ